jgi:ATP-GRASP peptide maturase of grasp-with-spasm system
MLCVASIRNDFSTNDVIDWIHQLGNGKQFIRINPEDNLTELKLQIEDSTIRVEFTVSMDKEKITIDLNRISFFWYRRGLFSYQQNNPPIRSKADFDIQTYLDKEWDRVSEFISNRLIEKKKIGNIKDNQLNKLEVLVKASRLGIAIPKTTVSTFSFEGESNMITKCIYNGGFTIEEKYSIGAFTNRVNESTSSTFFPSLFQEEVKKKYELRIFYFLGEFYSSAIFSQGNNKTEVDFRNYDKEKPNRVVPYQLPIDLGQKLKTLMDELNLETGSIDMIVTPEKKYVFLEVNPIGQFNQVSIPCNYFLEKKIADYLLHEN